MVYCYPASFQQRQFFWLQNLDQQSSAYNIPLIFTIDGDLDVSLLSQAFDCLIKSDEIFKSIFVTDEGQNLLISAQDREACFSVIDMLDKSAEIVMEHICSFVSEPFNLKKGPLYRTLLLKQSSNRFIWCIVLQHSICDLHTKNIICEFISNKYNSLKLNISSSSENLEISDYRAYSLKQYEWILSEEAKKMKAFWRDILKGYPDVLSLPLEFPRSPQLKLQGTVEYISFDDKETLALKEFSKNYEVTPFLCLLTAYSVLLSRLSNQDKLIIGVPFTNRRDKQFQQTIGCFVNTLPIPIDLSINSPISESMKLIRQMMLFAHRNQEVPTELIIKETSSAGIGLDRNPLYQAGFTFEPLSEMMLDGCTVQHQYVHHGGSQLDLFAVFWMEDNTLQGVFEYNDTLYSQETVRRWCQEFKCIVNFFVNNPSYPVHSVGVIDSEEKKLIDVSSKSSYSNP